MLISDAAVSPKRTSAASPSRCRPNARRARKLGAKLRRTNCSNIFRWYRPGWGRYTSADPLGATQVPNAYAYVDGDPISDDDALGLSARKKNCTKYAQNIQGALRHAIHHKKSGQSPRDICGMLNHWYKKFEDEDCAKIFPRHGEQAKDYLDKFCGGPGSCVGQHAGDPWWQQLEQWLNSLRKALPQPYGPPFAPPGPGPAPSPIGPPPPIE